MKKQKKSMGNQWESLLSPDIFRDVLDLRVKSIAAKK